MVVGIYKKCRKPLHQADKIETLKINAQKQLFQHSKTKNTTFPLVVHACDNKHLSRCFCLRFRLRRHTCFLDLSTRLSVVFIRTIQLFGGFLQGLPQTERQFHSCLCITELFALTLHAAHISIPNNFGPQVWWIQGRLGISRMGTTKTS